MSVSTARTVRESALEIPEATRVFEKVGIDYCCGGNRSLDEACAAAKLSVDDVLDSLEIAKEAAQSKQKDRNWQAELLAHINATHYKYTREEMFGPVLLQRRLPSSVKRKLPPTTWRGQAA